MIEEAGREHDATARQIAMRVAERALATKIAPDPDGRITPMNQRGGEYAELNYGDDGPSYPFMRHLGHEIQMVMGESQENRWVIDQVMDKDGPDIDREIRRAMAEVGLDAAEVERFLAALKKVVTSLRNISPLYQKSAKAASASELRASSFATRSFSLLRSTRRFARSPMSASERMESSFASSFRAASSSRISSALRSSVV